MPLVKTVSSFALLLLSFLTTSNAFAEPTTVPPLPTSQPADTDLPAGAVRIIGDGRLENTDNVRAVSFSTDGKWLATCQGNLDLWDLSTGLHVRRFDRDLLVNRCFFQKDGSLLVVCRDNPVGPGGRGNVPRAICVDPVKDEDLKELNLPAENGADGLLAVSPDSQRAVFAGLKQLKLIDTSNGQVLAELGDRPRIQYTRRIVISAADFSSDGKLLLHIDSQSNAIILDGVTGKPVDSKPVHAPLGAVLLDDGKRIAVAGDQIDLYNWKTGERIATLPDEPRPAAPARRRSNWIQVLSASPTQGLVAVATTDIPSHLLIWDTTQQPIQPPRVILTTQWAPGVMNWSPDGRRLALCGIRGRMQIINTVSGQPLYPIQCLRNITAMRVLSDGSAMLATDEDGKLARWDLSSGALTAQRTLAITERHFEVRLLGVRPADHSVIAVGQGGNVETVDEQTLVTRQLVHSNPGVLTAAFSSDGQVIAQLRRTGVTVWNTTTGADLCRITKKPGDKGDWTAVAITGNQSAVVISKPDGQQAYDLTNGAPGMMAAWPQQSFTNGLMKASPDGRWIAASSDAGTTFWSAEHPLGQSKRPPVWNISTPGRSADLVYSDAGDLVALARAYNGWTYRGPEAGSVIEIGHPQPLCTLPLTRGKIDLIRFVPHRPMLVSATRDGVAIVWDLSLLLDLKQSEQKSDRDLVDDLHANSPNIAYRAGLILLKRNKLAAIAAQCKPLEASTHNKSDPKQIPLLIQQLSSPNTTDREKAHKKLEGFGPLAIDAIQRALATHPGGELEDRLNDIAHVIGADDATSPPIQSVETDDAFIEDPEQLLTRRMIQLLDWSPVPADQQQRLQLIGSRQPATAEPPR